MGNNGRGEIVEETLQLILQELKGLKEGQQRLESRMDRLEAKVDKLDVDLQEVKRLARGTFEQVGMLTEFRTETIATLARHERMINKLAAKSL